jgi:hypothetical protein
MMKKIIKHMLEEKEDFYEYMHMYSECTDPVAKGELRKIAEEEMHHYKHLYDIAFGKADEHNMTMIEKGIYDYATDNYKLMLKMLESPR